MKMLPWRFNHNITINLMQQDSGGLKTSWRNAIEYKKTAKNFLKMHQGRGTQEGNNESGFSRMKDPDTFGKS